MVLVVSTPTNNMYRVDVSVVPVEKNGHTAYKSEILAVYNIDGKELSMSDVDENEAFYIETEVKHTVLEKLYV